MSIPFMYSWIKNQKNKWETFLAIDRILYQWSCSQFGINHNVFKEEPKQNHPLVIPLFSFWVLGVLFEYRFTYLTIKYSKGRSKNNTNWILCN
jgi:hypothetical protein